MNDKAVLLSIQPRWCGLITNGKKTIEVRKTRPKIDTPFKMLFIKRRTLEIYQRPLRYVEVSADEP